MKLRDMIFDELNRYESEQKSKACNECIDRLIYARYPTWWFKFKVPFTTPQIRRELYKMESEGLVVKYRVLQNSTMWVLSKEGK